MKLITAIIKPFKLDEVRKAVADLGIQGVTVTEVHGYRLLAGHGKTYRGAEADFVPKAKVELAVDDSIAEQVTEALCNIARTGNAGDGKIWVFELEQALRVRTGETGPDAI
ncbi:MAG TPA: P-II family nitrogen regulator [Steroidobacteraceae bacterium]|jgi:nitrogen regulatory protein P-II 2|nr:P-II family nitrogen regulator [Steroidobacteraceae bacterium]